MLGYYRFAGLLAVCGLALYMLFTLAALAGVQRRAHAARPRGVRALDRHRGGRQRADLRAHS
jgi:hypothetical protein